MKGTFSGNLARNREKFAPSKIRVVYKGLVGLREYI